MRLRVVDFTGRGGGTEHAQDAGYEVLPVLRVQADEVLESYVAPWPPRA
jgi:hypothetical protein